MTAQHSAEPWGVNLDADSLGTHTNIVHKAYPWINIARIIPRAEEITIANAHRIVACVNAMAGVDDPEAEIARLRQDKAELVALMDRAVKEQDEMNLESILGEMEAAIAKARKGE